jgi:hypothetical protein
MRNLIVSFKGMQVPFLVVLACLFFGHLATLSSDGSDDETKSHCAKQTVKEPQDVHDWFAEYDAIRRHAKMSLKEKIQSRHLFMMFLNPMAFFSNDAQPLLERMIAKYTQAIEQMEQLKSFKETADLQQGYLRYFKDARKLFADICDAQNTTPEERRKILPELMQRKRDLEALDQKNKLLDGRLRIKYDVPPMKS